MKKLNWLINPHNQEKVLFFVGIITFIICVFPYYFPEIENFAKRQIVSTHIMSDANAKSTANKKRSNLTTQPSANPSQ